MVEDNINQWRAAGRLELTVCLVTDSPALQVGLFNILNNIDSVGQVFSLESITEYDSRCSGADVLLLAPGFDSALELKKVLDDSPEVGILLLGVDDLQLGRLLATISDHALGILPLEATAEQIEVTLHALSSGLSVGMPDLVNALFWEGAIDLDEEPIEPLTDRELEVLQMLAQGLTNKQIAAALEISTHTVKFHVSSIYSKLGAASRTEAVRLGVRRGLILL